MKISTPSVALATILMAFSFSSYSKVSTSHKISGSLGVMVSDESANLSLQVLPKGVTHNTTFDLGVDYNTSDDVIYHIGLFNLNDQIKSKLKFNDRFILGAGAKVNQTSLNNKFDMTNVSLTARLGVTFKDVFNQEVYIFGEHSPNVLSSEKVSMSSYGVNYEVSILHGTKLIAGYKKTTVNFNNPYTFEDGAKIGITLAF